MHKKLTITLDEKVYDGLYNTIGPKRISQFIESLLRPHVIAKELDVEYQAMAQEEAREAEGHEWSEALIGDVADHTR
jgi:hypothetical protein